MSKCTQEEAKLGQESMPSAKRHEPETEHVEVEEEEDVDLPARGMQTEKKDDEQKQEPNEFDSAFWGKKDAEGKKEDENELELRSAARISPFKLHPDIDKNVINYVRKQYSSSKREC